MSTIVLSPRHSEDSDAIEQAAGQAGWAVQRLDSWRAPQNLDEHRELAFYGEALFVRVVADQLSYILLEAPPDWLSQLPDKYIRRKIDAISLGEAFDLKSPAFIKPAGDKAFISRVYESGVELAAHAHNLSKEIRVLVSEPVVWEIECRCFVLDGKVQTVATYIYENEIARTENNSWVHLPLVEQQAGEFADGLLSDMKVICPPAFVVDVGLTADRGWAVLEANPAWASGIYGCKAEAVLPVLQRACIHPDDLTESDRRWISKLESWDPE